MDFKDIVRKYLLDNGFDGLFDPNDECGCEINDLFPCWEAGACEPGYKVPCDCGEGCGFHITRNAILEKQGRVEDAS